MIYAKLNSKRKRTQRKRALFFYILSGSVIRFRIAFCCVCLKQDIIDTYIVKISQKNQNFSGKLLCSCFEVTVFALSNADTIRNILLSVIVVFAQSLNTIHHKQVLSDAF